MLPFASFTDIILDPIVNAGTDFIGSTGLPAVFILMTLESACLPIPSEAIMLFAGASVAEGELSLVGVIVAGVLGNLVGSWIAYAAGYYARLDLLEKNRLIHLPPRYLKWADDWFQRYGSVTVFFTRMLPIIRTFISLPAGVAKMPFWRFTALTLAGCIPWVVALALIGRAVGENWEQWRDHLHYLDYAVIVAAIGLIAYLLIRRRRARRTGPEPAGSKPRLIPRGPALALGVLQGPAELLPVSSSAHIVLVPWLADWEWDELDAEVRKSFEVALHAGAAAALLIGQRHLIVEELRNFDARRALLLGLSFIPAAIVGYTLERPIEQRLEGRVQPPSGSSPAGRRWWSPIGGPRRGAGDATPADGLVLGIAQAAALVPGVSRNGITLAAARWRRFSRDQSNLLSRTVALPIIVGASILKGVRLQRRGTSRELRRALAIGVAASFASTLASQRLIQLVERDRALWPYAVYRAGLAAAVLAKLGQR